MRTKQNDLHVLPFSRRTCSSTSLIHHSDSLINRMANRVDDWQVKWISDSLPEFQNILEVTKIAGSQKSDRLGLFFSYGKSSFTTGMPLLQTACHRKQHQHV